MKHIEVSLYFEEHSYKAVQEALARDGVSVEDKLNGFFRFLYEQFVPAEQQTTITAEIQREEAEEAARREAARRFAVFHVREGGNHYYFTSDHFQTLLSAAYRYRLYSRDELSETHEAFADAFIETDPISVQQFVSACSNTDADKRITAVMEFDLDSGMVIARNGGDDMWHTFSLHDISVAAYRAFRSNFRTTNARQEIFDDFLAGREIGTSLELEQIEDDGGIGMQM